MKKKEIILYLMIIILITFFAFITYMYLKTTHIYENNSNDLTNKIFKLNEEVTELEKELENIRFGQTFYATIVEIKTTKKGTTMLHVKCLDINNRDHIGDYYITISDMTLITWNGKVINISELDIGDNIAITYTDESIATMYPPTLSEIVRIRLLDDEK